MGTELAVKACGTPEMMQAAKTHSISALDTASSSSMRNIKWAILGRDRSLPHLGRKFYHFLMGMGCFALYAFFLSREESLLALVTIGGALIAVDFFRLRYSAVNRVALRLFGKLMRREELKSFSGNSFYVLGMVTVVLFFPKTIVLLSVLFLAIGDPSAAVFGTLYGKHRLIGKKSLEGGLANFLFTAIASVLFGSLYLGMDGHSEAGGWTWIPGHQMWILGLIGGTVSFIAELFPAPIDDNFSIPVLSAILLSIVQGFFPIF